MSPPLCYCGNVHPAKDLDELLHSLAHGPALVRKELGLERMAYGLWLSSDALAASRAEDHQRLREALDQHGLEVWTINGFPQGNFHAEVVKYQVYHPNWLTDERREYTVQLAELLARLMPANTPVGTISTLPLGYWQDLAVEGARTRAAENLCRTAEALARIEAETGRRIRLCLEPEPACALERARHVEAFWNGELAQAAHQMGLSEAMDAHLGVCVDTCHHAVEFEDARELLETLQAARIPIGKFQLSSAVHIDPADSEARRALAELDEPKFLHQTRLLHHGDRIQAWNDLPQVPDELEGDALRVHYHLPIHRESHGALSSTQEQLREVLQLYPTLGQSAQLEVETYTWSVLPEHMRPTSDQGLARCIADEIRFVQEVMR